MAKRFEIGKKSVLFIQYTMSAIKIKDMVKKNYSLQSNEAVFSGSPDKPGGLSI